MLSNTCGLRLTSFINLAEITSLQSVRHRHLYRTDVPSSSCLLKMVVTLTADDFGVHAGQTVKKFTWRTGSGFSLSAISYGAIVQAIKVPDINGDVKDIVLGFDDLHSYVSRNKPYLGAAVGRCANRIAGATFEIDGERFPLPKNIGENHLHGGVVGFDKVEKSKQLTALQNIKKIDNEGGPEQDRKARKMRHPAVSAHAYLSPHDEEGYPGDVIVSVTYDVTDDDELLMNFTASTDRKTVVNLTNHSYFNLAGHDGGADELYKHVITINADKITETDSQSIPTGRFKNVGGTPFDLRTPTKLGDVMGKSEALFDDNFCVSTHGNKGLNFVSRVVHPPSGRTLEVYSDQPGVQLYTGNFLNAPSEPSLQGKAGVGYRRHGAFCLETQNYPDAVNHTNFPSAVLSPGEVYTHAVVYKFGVEKSEGTPHVVPA